MKKTVKIFLLFVAAAAICLCLALSAVMAYVAITKPFGVKVTNIPSAIIKATGGEVKSTYDHPLLTTQQESTLESLGVDTQALPTSLTPQLKACFTTKLGADRVKVIEGGATITTADYFKVQSCLQ